MFGRILKLGWKNVWRNPTRSGVVIIAVLLGIWAGVFLSGLFSGMMEGYLHNQFELSVAHIEMAHPEFDDLNNPDYFIPDADSVVQHLQEKPFITDISMQSIAAGLAQSARSNYGVTIHGLAADSSYGVEQYLVQGSLPDEAEQRNPILIGQALAERLDVNIGTRMVLSFQDTSGEITGGAFRVAGLFDSFSNPYDEGNVFVGQDNLNSLLGLEHQVHAIRLELDDFSKAETYAADLRTQFPNLEIKTWGETAPQLQYAFSMMDLMLYIVMIIIIIALVFSIINTMLMAVLERTRELGMLRAIGMNKSRVFSMIVAETVFLTMVAVPIGLLLSWGTISYFTGIGIDLSAFSEGLGAYGLSTVIYPQLPPVYYFNIALLIAAAALLSALYPAWKALQLNPVEAIRKFN